MMGDRPPVLTTDSASDASLVQQHAEMLLAAGALGRSRALERLFRFLLACTLEGRSPKELEIAEEVFGRSAESIDQDASVRVHIHRLRRKLEEYYRGPGAGQPVRLVIPKADYRLAIEPRKAIGKSPAADAVKNWRWRQMAIAAGLLVLAGIAGWWIGNRTSVRDSALAEVRASALWRPVLASSRRVSIIVGDYYIFGERDETGQIARMVREFDVNSPADLERLVAANPARSANYVDLGLNYLPIGAGNALRVVTPILLGNEGGVIPSFVVPMSKLSPELVKYTNLVYLGYLSGLGSLRDPLFSNSRFAIGRTYDEIVDHKTGKTYIADAPLGRGDASTSQDYAIVSTFRGVTGNTIIVIAGTRDAGLMQAAEFVSRPEGLAQLAGAQQGDAGFEALLAIESLNNVGLRARLIAASPRKGEADWSGSGMQAFPDEPRAPPTTESKR